MKIINKTPNQIIDIVRQENREIDAVIALANSVKTPYKGTMQEYQAACLYALAKQYNTTEFCNVLEIGTGKGYSTSFLAQALPNADITTLSVREDESEQAKNIVRNNLGFKNVEFVIAKSWEYYQLISDPNHSKYQNYDFIFVDGDHARVRKDLVYWNSLNEGGLILFHDYCPKHAANPQEVVYDALNDFKQTLTKTDFDVIVTDDVNIGMVGFYK